ncbi:preprotein translocase subunit SecF [bacterium BMS3Abin05]|nr:preprotein translocase subunit SecF [bacterium BMS3Abin05]
MQFFKKPSIDFIGNRKFGYMFSGTLIFITLVLLIVRGPNYGIDFRGGVSVRVKFDNTVTVKMIRNSLQKIGYGNAEIKETSRKTVGGIEKEMIIQVELTRKPDVIASKVTEQLKKDFSKGLDIRSIDTVGPKIGGELRRAAIWAVLFSMLLILVYITLRFEFRFAVGAIIPLFHDVLITLGFFLIFNLQISLDVVAAFLTIVGYSLNDTIVVFDRIRENMRTRRRESFSQIINESINETLSRTVITSFTTFLVILVLFLFGGEVIHDFSFAMLVGVVIGTYSSIFVAAPLLIEWEHYSPRHKKMAEVRARKAHKPKRR